MPLTDARLAAICEMLPSCAVVADIGADHGRLGAQLILNGACERVWFSDISAESLQKARALIGRLGLSEKADFFVGDGANALPDAPNAAVIAGMGGATISGILENAGGKLDNTALVLQPNVGTTELRRTLERVGFRISDERIVRAGNRWYVLIRAERGEMRLSPREAVAGPVLLLKNDENFRLYAAFRKRVAEKALAGAKKSPNADTEALEFELSVWKGMGECL